MYKQANRLQIYNHFANGIKSGLLKSIRACSMCGKPLEKIKDTWQLEETKFISLNPWETSNQ